MIYTACFFKVEDHHGEVVSIANSAPKMFSGNTLRSFNPPWIAVKQLKEKYIDWSKFCEIYAKHLGAIDVATNKDVEFVKNALVDGIDITLVCWEKTPEKCHRNLLIEWLAKELGFNIQEDGMK